MNRLLCTAAIACLPAVLLPAADPALLNPAWTGRTMGTTYSIRVAGSPLDSAQLERLKADVDARLAEVNRQMSHYRPDSELSRFSVSTSTAPFKVSAEFASVTRFSIKLHHDSGGIFDPTLGPLINLWGFGQRGVVTEPPSPEAIAAALKIIGCSHLRVTASNELQKDLPELQMNLSAVAKGFGVDEAARVIRLRGLTNVFVEIGGEVVAFGRNAQGAKWRVGIEAPIPEAPPGAELQAVVPLSAAAMATSGDYRNVFADASGRVYSHILDPRTGQPVRHNIGSVSVIAENCLVADGYATTLFALGAEQGLRWIETRSNAAALFILREPDGRFKILPSSRFPAFETRPAE